MRTRITYTPIGVIKTSFTKIAEMPVQPCGAAGSEGIIELKREYIMGLVDLVGFSYLILLYHFHLVNHPKLKIKSGTQSVRMIVKFRTIKIN